MRPLLIRNKYMSYIEILTQYINENIGFLVYILDCNGLRWGKIREAIISAYTFVIMGVVEVMRIAFAKVKRRAAFSASH